MSRHAAARIQLEGRYLGSRRKGTGDERLKNQVVGCALMAFWPAAWYDVSDGWCDRSWPMGCGSGLNT